MMAQSRGPKQDAEISLLCETLVGFREWPLEEGESALRFADTSCEGNGLHAQKLKDSMKCSFGRIAAPSVVILSDEILIKPSPFFQAFQPRRREPCLVLVLKRASPTSLSITALNFSVARRRKHRYPTSRRVPHHTLNQQCPKQQQQQKPKRPVRRQWQPSRV